MLTGWRPGGVRWSATTSSSWRNCPSATPTQNSSGVASSVPSTRPTSSGPGVASLNGAPAAVGAGSLRAGRDRGPSGASPEVAVGAPARAGRRSVRPRNPSPRRTATGVVRGGCSAGRAPRRRSPGTRTQAARTAASSRPSASSRRIGRVLVDGVTSTSTSWQPRAPAPVSPSRHHRPPPSLVRRRVVPSAATSASDGPPARVDLDADTHAAVGEVGAERPTVRQRGQRRRLAPGGSVPGHGRRRCARPDRPLEADSVVSEGSCSCARRGPCGRTRAPRSGRCASRNRVSDHSSTREAPRPAACDSTRRTSAWPGPVPVPPAPRTGA